MVSSMFNVYGKFLVSISLSCFLINSDNRPTLLTKHETQTLEEKKCVWTKNVLSKNVFNVMYNMRSKKTLKKITRTAQCYYKN